MALLDGLKKTGDGVSRVTVGKKGKVHNLPTKRNLNLATVGVKPLKPSVVIPAVVLIVLAAAVLSKFFVLDRMVQVSKAEAEVSAMQSQVNAAYDRLDDFGELTNEYAHFTYSGMTAEELSRTDRIAVIDLLERVVVPQAWFTNWTLSGNTLTLDITRGDLQEINLLIQQMNEEPLVDFCTITNASTTNRTQRGRVVEEQNEVTSQMVVYLKNKDDAEAAGVVVEEAEEAKQKSSLFAAIDKATETADQLDQAARETEQRFGEGNP